MTITNQSTLSPGRGNAVLPSRWQAARRIVVQLGHCLSLPLTSGRESIVGGDCGRH